MKLNADAVDALNELAEARNISRSELIEEMLIAQLETLRSQGISLKIPFYPFHVAQSAVLRDSCFRRVASSAIIALSVAELRHHTIKFQEVILLMAIIGIFFGSDTGNTENIAKHSKQLGKDVADVHDIAKSSKEDLGGLRHSAAGYPNLGNHGEAQCDWDDFFPTLEEVDFNGKLVALFGCGDQEDYAEYFCDALGHHPRHH